MTIVICFNGIIYMVLNYKINQIGMYYMVLKSSNNDRKIIFLTVHPGCLKDICCYNFRYNNHHLEKEAIAHLLFAPK